MNWEILIPIGIMLATLLVLWWRLWEFQGLHARWQKRCLSCGGTSPFRGLRVAVGRSVRFGICRGCGKLRFVVVEPAAPGTGPATRGR